MSIERAELVKQAEKMLLESARDLAEAQTQDDYHRVDTKVQMIQASCLLVIAKYF